MAFPPSLALVTVTCQANLPPSSAAAARFTFTAPGPITVPADGAVVPPVPITVVTDEGGAATVQLPATNDPQATPVGWSYAVRMECEGISSFGTLQLNHTDTSVELSDLIQWSGAAVTGSTYATLAQLNAVAVGAPSRVTAVGELLLPRDGLVPIPLVPGRMHCTVYTARETLAVKTVRTGMGGADTLAVDASSAWLGVLRWNGTTWDPTAVSVNDPSRWTAEAEYPTAVYGVTPGVGTPNLSVEGFTQVAGDTYAFWTIWNGAAEDAPSLFAAVGSARDARIDPTIAMYMDLSAPPSSALNDGWLVGDDRAYQGWLRA